LVTESFAVEDFGFVVPSFFLLPNFLEATGVVLVVFTPLVIFLTLDVDVDFLAGGFLLFGLFFEAVTRNSVGPSQDGG
jgi:hypothetical protein